MQAYLPACKIVTTHGVRGEMRCLPLCDGADFLADCTALYPTPEGGDPYTLESIRPQGNMLLLFLEEVEDMDAARAMVGKTLYFDRAEVELPEGRYFVEDMMGCAVQDADTGRVYGKITAIDQGAQELYTITAEDGAVYLLPAVKAFIQSIDVEAGLMLVTPIPGLFTEPENGDEDGTDAY